MYIDRLISTESKQLKRRFLFTYVYLREIKNIVIHCTAGRLRTKAEAVQQFFLKSKSLGGRGWDIGGYHVIIEHDGTAVFCYPDNEVTNGVIANAGISNTNSINIALTGGLKWDNFTRKQKNTLSTLLLEYTRKYPSAKVLGHNQIARKACPTFDVRRFAAEAGVKQSNIFHHDAEGVLHWMNQVKHRYM